MPEIRPEPVAPADRLAIEDVIGRYVWAIDRGDIDAVVALFTPDATVRYGDGQLYEGPGAIRAFALRAIGGIEARGRMHVVRPLFAEALEGGDLLLRSYLMVPQHGLKSSHIVLRTLRYVEDRFRLTPSGWRIHERSIFVWDGTPLRAAMGVMGMSGEDGPTRD